MTTCQVWEREGDGETKRQREIQRYENWRELVFYTTKNIHIQALVLLGDLALELYSLKGDGLGLNKAAAEHGKCA